MSPSEQLACERERADRAEAELQRLRTDHQEALRQLEFADDLAEVAGVLLTRADAAEALADYYDVQFRAACARASELEALLQECRREVLSAAC